MSIWWSIVWWALSITQLLKLIKFSRSAIWRALSIKKIQSSNLCRSAKNRVFSIRVYLKSNVLRRLAKRQALSIWFYVKLVVLKRSAKRWALSIRLFNSIILSKSAKKTSSQYLILCKINCPEEVNEKMSSQY